MTREPVRFAKGYRDKRGTDTYELDLMELGSSAASALVCSSRYPMLQIETAIWEAEHLRTATAMLLRIPPPDVLWPPSRKERLEDDASFIARISCSGRPAGTA